MKNEHAKSRFINTFFVLALMLASIAVAPAPAQAQVGGNNIYLPILADGLAPEIQAAGSCYNNKFDSWVMRHDVLSYKTRQIKVNENGSHCNDLNIHTGSLAPLSGCIKYTVSKYNKKGEYVGNSGVNWICRYPEVWKVLTYGLNDDYSYSVHFWTQQSPGKVTFAD